MFFGHRLYQKSDYIKSQQFQTEVINLYVCVCVCVHVCILIIGEISFNSYIEVFLSMNTPFTMEKGENELKTKSNLTLKISYSSEICLPQVRLWQVADTEEEEIN